MSSGNSGNKNGPHTCEPENQSPEPGLNWRPLPYHGSALPLSYRGALSLLSQTVPRQPHKTNIIYVTMRNRVLGVVGIFLAVWMGAGRWAFGIGGDLTIWFVPLITVPFIVLQLWSLRRARVAADRGRPVGRQFYVATIVAWLCAIGFGFTVPDSVHGELVSVMSLLVGEDALGMSIALCNPFGIIAFSGIIAALIFAIMAGRDPRPSEDDLLGDAEVIMVNHPLK